ncbi:MAG: ATP-binding cassette domain-containing protein [Clostridiales bacterium]|nr:ATP-binding cassette domain-containing protein [Clostridiales bacterium]
MSEDIIVLQQLSKCFVSEQGQVQALQAINLSIRKGEIFGIIGRSGAGKSTLVRCINLLERPSEGRVIVDGQELTALSPAQLRKQRHGIGMIFQGFHLLMQKTALQNVCFPLLITGVPRGEAEKRASALLDEVGLSDKKNAYPAQLSGGQMQRVAIARALATNPKVLLCDEATSALDPETTQSILDLLREINRRHGITIVVITHEMRVVEEICHRVAELKDGLLLRVGSVEEVLGDPSHQTVERLTIGLPQDEETALRVRCYLLSEGVLFEEEGAAIGRSV